jgi:DNA polymerase-3 subunit delta
VRLRPDQLPKALERGLAPLYLITGDEPLQRMECADAVRARARTEGFGERQVFDVDSGFDWSALLAETQSLSLFAERRLIELRLPAGKIAAEGGRLLQGYASAPPEDTLLLIQAPKLERPAQQSAWLKAVEAAGVWVQVWPLRGEETSQWVAGRLLSRGLQPGAGVAELLASRVQGNLLAAAQEVEKLALLCPPGPLELEAVVDAVADSARYSVFDLGDAALAGDARGVARALAGLRGEGIEPVLVLWVLAREVRTLLGLAEAIERGEPVQRLLATVKPQTRQALYGRALKRLNVSALRALLGDCARMDRVIKGRERGKPWTELLNLGFRLAGEAVPAPSKRRPPAPVSMVSR